MASNQDDSSVVRLKDKERQTFNREKLKRNSGEGMKEKNKKRKLQEKQLVSGSIKFYVENDEEKISFLNKLDRAKLCISEKISSVNNYTVLNNVLDTFLETNGATSNIQQEPGHSHNTKTDTFNKYLYCQREDTFEQLSLCTDSAIKNMVQGIQSHNTTCKEHLEQFETQSFGHVRKFTFKCSGGHEIRFDTSPHIEGGKFLANLRMIHGVNTSGLRYVQYQRFCNEAGLGTCSETMFSDIHEIYCQATQTCAENSIQNAIHEEIGQAVANLEDPSQFEGIDIITDARHGTRKNSAFSDIITLGGTTHKVLSAETVSKKDEQISQRHELVGVKRMYKTFESKNVKVRIHGHDRNSSVNKYLSSEQKGVKDANDTWHAAKGIAKALKAITSGPKKKMGTTWHEELSDKGASIKTAAYHAMKNCDRSPTKLRELLENIPEHYKGNHTKCASNARCKLEGDSYECSKCTLKDPIAVDLQTKTIRKLQIYRTPEDYINCIDTHYVESFNNATLIYHDKRITFGEKEYKRRTLLSVLDWNENVDRDCTSVVLFEDVRNPRRRTGHKNLRPKTYSFVTAIWEKVMDALY